MEDLLPELIGEIAKYLSITSYNELRLVSKRYHRYLARKMITFDSMLNDPDIYLFASNPENEVRFLRYRRANLKNISQRLRGNYKYNISRKGDYDIKQHLISMILHSTEAFYTRPMIVWAKVGYLDNMIWFVGKTRTGLVRKVQSDIHHALNSSVFEAAAEGGNLEIMKWLRQQKCGISDRVFTIIYNNRNVKNIEWMNSVWPRSRRQCQ